MRRKNFRSIIALFSVLWLMTSAFAIAKEVKFVGSGKYLRIGNDTFWLKGVKDVKGLGVYGRKTGTGFWSGGFLVKNGFEAHGDLGAINEFSATTAKASGEIISSAAGSTGIDLGAISNLKPVSGELDTKIKNTSEYAVIVVSPSNWEDMYLKLQEEFDGGSTSKKKRLQDKNSRVIDSVVYATNFEIETDASYSADIEGGSTGSNIKISAQLGGSIDKKSTFILTGKQIIAYSFRRLCWDDDLIISARVDIPGLGDTGGCSN